MATQDNTKISNSQIVQVQASFYTQKELENFTVVEVTRRCDKIKEKKPKKKDLDSQITKVVRDIENSGVSVTDTRMGATDESACTTCNQSIERCPGHFGRITVAKPFLTRVEAQIQVLNAILNSFCDSCMKSDVNCDSRHSSSFPTLIYDSSTLQRVINLNSSTRLFALANMGLKCPLHGVSYEVKSKWNYAKRKYGNDETIVKPEMLSQYMSKMRSEDLEKIGVLSRPEAMIVSIVPVMPNYLRLNYVDEEGIIHPQGINSIYGKLVDLNNNIKTALMFAPSAKQEKDKQVALTVENVRKMSVDTLNMFIDHCIDGIRDQHYELIFSPETKNNTKSIKMILDKKKGLLRNNVHGKRGNYCARSTVAPDPTLNISEVGLPRSIANELTTLEIVRRNNIQELQELLAKNGIKSIKRRRIVEMNSNLPEDLMDFDNVFVSVLIDENNKEEITKLQSERRVFSIKRRDETLQKDATIRVGDNVIIIKMKKNLVASDDIVGYERKGNNILIKSLDSSTIMKIRFREGDAVHRFLRNGDVVLVGRNPSLHKHSLLALFVEIKDGYTIRMPVQLCAGYAMDFDGDEANVFVPQGYMTKKNVIANMTPQECLFSEQTHKIIVGIVQDSLMGSYFITSPDILVPEPKWTSLAMSCFKYFDRSFPFKNKIEQPEWFNNVKKRATSLGMDSLSGKTLFSVVFPESFQFLYMRPDDNVEIKNGILVSGTLNAEVLYKGNNSIVQTYVKSYGPYLGAELISNISRLCQGYVSQLGFSVGMSDCMKPELQETIKLKIGEKLESARKKSEQVSLHPILEARKEQDIFSTLNENLKSDLANIIFSQKDLIKIKPSEDITLVYTNGKDDFVSGDSVSQIEINHKKKELTLFGSEGARKFSTKTMSHVIVKGETSTFYKVNKQEDAFASMLSAGAKGEKFQLSQIYGAIGQSVFSGQRIPFSMAGNTRVLPHFVSNDKDPIARGFSTSSYVSGMNPVEFYMNFIQAREPQTDTTLKTARTGYVQRKLSKFMADLVARKDGSVQTEKNRIVTYQYGVWGSSLDKVVDVDGEAQFSNIKQRYLEAKNVLEQSDQAYVFVINNQSEIEDVFISAYQIFERRLKFYRHWVSEIDESMLKRWNISKNKVTSETVYDCEKLFNIDDLKKDITLYDDSKLEIPDLVKKWRFELMVSNTVKILSSFKDNIMSLYSELKMKNQESLFIPILNYKKRDLYVYTSNISSDNVEKLNYVFDMVMSGSPDEVIQLPQHQIVLFQSSDVVIEGSDDKVFELPVGVYGSIAVIKDGSIGPERDPANNPYKRKSEKGQYWSILKSKSQNLLRTEIL